MAVNKPYGDCLVYAGCFAGLGGLLCPKSKDPGADRGNLP